LNMGILRENSDKLKKDQQRKGGVARGVQRPWLEEWGVSRELGVSTFVVRRFATVMYTGGRCVSKLDQGNQGVHLGFQGGGRGGGGKGRGRGGLMRWGEGGLQFLPGKGDIIQELVAEKNRR